MALKTYKSLSLAHAATQLAVDIKLGGREARDGKEWGKLLNPAVIEFPMAHRLCPRMLSLGDPFQLLLASYGWMFPPSESSRYPKHFDPMVRMPAEASPSAIASGVLGSGRQVLQVGNFVATFETVGSPEDHGMISMNLIVTTGSVFEVLGHWGVRWMMMHQAVAAYTGLMIGQMTMFVIHPCAPMDLCEGVISESSDMPEENDQNTSVGLVAGDPGEWVRDVRMFLDEHIWANGYQDRFIQSVAKPAMTAWHNLIDPDLSPEDRVARCLENLKSVRDEEWRIMLSRFAKMQGA